MSDIELVIKIDKEEYETIKACTSFMPWTEYLIKNGTPLNEVLDNIKAEIEELDRYYDNDYFSTNNCPMYKCNEVLQIIDKYKTESEKV